jgi:adenylate cyclase
MQRHGPAVLLVDDQAIVGETVRRMLAADDDIAFRHCQDPTQAIEVALSFGPTVILLDLVMPTVDGLTVLQFLRAHPTTQNIPVVVLSSKEEPTTKVAAFAAGASDYIVKLPDERELLARVRHHSAGYVSRIERDAAQAELRASHEALRRLNQDLQLRNRFIQETFGRYLDDDVVDELLHDPQGLEMGGEKRVVTILMADLRGFTSMSERLEADQVVQLLNLFLGAMADVITRHRGMIDNFLGDSILAVFGVPRAGDDDAARAVACALELQRAMPGLNETLQREGLPAVEMGIAVHTGMVVLGNIGSDRRAKYGVVGSHVNLVARIEGTSVGGQVLVSEATLRECGSSRLIVREELSIRAKGFRDPIVVHDVVGVQGADEIRLATRDLDWTPIDPGIPVLLWPLEGKSVGADAIEGVLVRAGGGAVSVHCGHPLLELTDLKILPRPTEGVPVPEEAYGKITRGWDPATRTFDLRLTWVPDSLAALLAAARGGVA